MWLIGSKKGSSPRKKNSSFTLIEALIVIVIISILVGVSLPRFRGTFEGLRFQNFCQDLASRMRYLGERASVEQVFYRIVIDSENHLIEISFKANPLKGSFASCEGRLCRGIPIPGGVELETETSRILFLPDGSIVGDDITVRDARSSVTIEINNALGTVTLKENKKP